MVVSSSKYLGVTIPDHLSWTNCAKMMYKQRKQDCGLPPEEFQSLPPTSLWYTTPYTRVQLSGTPTNRKMPSCFKRYSSERQQLWRLDTWYCTIAAGHSEIQQPWAMQAPQPTLDSVPDQQRRVGRHQPHRILPTHRPQDKRSTASTPRAHPPSCPV